MSRRGELDRQPDGLDHGMNPNHSSNLSAYLNPDGGGDGAGNTEKDIDFQVIAGWGIERLTCGTRARSIVMMEVSRTQHRRTAVVYLFGFVVCEGKPRTGENEEHTAEERDRIR